MSKSPKGKNSDTSSKNGSNPNDDSMTHSPVSSPNKKKVTPTEKEKKKKASTTSNNVEMETNKKKTHDNEIYIKTQIHSNLKKGHDYHVEETLPDAIGNILIDLNYLILLNALFHSFIEKKRAKAYNEIIGSSSSSASTQGGGNVITITYEQIASSLVYLDEILKEFGISINDNHIIPLIGRNPKYIPQEMGAGGGNESVHAQYLFNATYLREMGKKPRRPHRPPSSEKPSDEKNKDFQKFLKKPIKFKGFGPQLNDILYDIIDVPEIVTKAKHNEKRN